MKRILLISVLFSVLILTACGGKTTNTGIKGQVFLAECMGNAVAADCFSQEPYQATLIIYTAAYEEVTRIETEADGKFTLELEPGVYYLHPYSASAYPIANDYHLGVVEGEWTEITVVYDSGIR